MIKITKSDIQRGKHEPEKTLSEELAPAGAILLLLTIIYALFI